MLRSLYRRPRLVGSVGLPVTTLISTVRGSATGAPAGDAKPAAAEGSPVSGNAGAGDEAVPKRRIRFVSGFSNKGVDADERGNFFSAFASMSAISLGCTFLFVPIYRMYCSTTGQGADPKFYTKEAMLQRERENNKQGPIKKKLLKVRFLSDVGNTMPIAFVPLQKSLDVLIGEPALAFYSAYNRSNRTLLGVSSYNISPPEATNYLNKIQCFCFEEQRFKPHELVEMPVFFYIDKDFLNDPLINWLDEVILNYTFFNLERTRDQIFRTEK